MGLEIACGDRIEIVASGPDAGDAVQVADPADSRRPWRRAARRAARRPPWSRPPAALGRSERPRRRCGLSRDRGGQCRAGAARHAARRGERQRRQGRTPGARRGARTGKGGARCPSGAASARRRGRQGGDLRRTPRTARRPRSAGDCRRCRFKRQDRGIRVAAGLHTPCRPAGDPEERAVGRARQRPARRRAARAAEADRRGRPAGQLRGRYDSGRRRAHAVRHGLAEPRAACSACARRRAAPRPTWRSSRARSISRSSPASIRRRSICRTAPP